MQMDTDEHKMPAYMALPVSPGYIYHTHRYPLHEIAKACCKSNYEKLRNRCTQPIAILTNIGPSSEI